MSISKFDEIIDSRNVIKRIEELEEERQSLQDDVDIANTEDPPNPSALNEAEEALSEWDSGDDAEELKTLKALAEEGEGYSDDWRHGAQLINEDYFETYAREFAEDMHGAEMRSASWPFSCIDWEQAAAELQQDYSAIDFDGQTFWVR
jgi:hypothetical protein